jgi:hypothetical protein
MAMGKKDIYRFVHRTVRVYPFTQMDKSAHYDDTIRQLDYGAWIEEGLCGLG